MTNRKYRDFTIYQVAAIIIADIVQFKKSEGWSGTTDELKLVKDMMYKFNVVYTDDFNGTWELKGQTYHE